MFERSDTTARFYVDAPSGDDQAVRDGFRWALDYARANSHEQALLITPGLRNVDDLARSIGRNEAAALTKFRRLDSDGVTFVLATQAKLPSAFTDGPVLAIWTRDRALDKIDTLDAPAICAVAWSPRNIEGWKANWNPVDVRSGAKRSEADALVSPVVEQALEDLTIFVNVGTGLADPSDRASAVQLFKLLRAAGEPFDPKAVGVWAVRHGWDPVDARQLSDVAAKIRDGRALRAGNETMWRPNVVAQWRAVAARTTSDET